MYWCALHPSTKPSPVNALMKGAESSVRTARTMTSFNFTSRSFRYFMESSIPMASGSFAGLSARILSALCRNPK